jgi:hypothetical protein
MKNKASFFIGQKVIVTTKHDEFVSEVINITPTGLVSVKGRNHKYKPNGRYYKDYWNYSHISDATPEKIKEIEVLAMADRLSCTDFSKLENSMVEKLYNILMEE